MVQTGMAQRGECHVDAEGGMSEAWCYMHLNVSSAPTDTTRSPSGDWAILRIREACPVRVATRAKSVLLHST